MFPWVLKSDIKKVGDSTFANKPFDGNMVELASGIPSEPYL